MLYSWRYSEKGKYARGEVMQQKRNPKVPQRPESSGRCDQGWALVVVRALPSEPPHLLWFKLEARNCSKTLEKHKEGSDVGRGVYPLPLGKRLPGRPSLIVHDPIRVQLELRAAKRSGACFHNLIRYKTHSIINFLFCCYAMMVM